MKFRTEFSVPKFNFKTDHQNKILTIGSCFAENIAEYLRYYKFQVESNPFGVLYNPVSILSSLKIIRDNRIFSKNDLIFDQTEWHSFYHHSDFSHHNPDVCLANINNTTKHANEFIEQCNLFIISYGTSYVYVHKKKKIVVSNCHKIPRSQFEKKLLPKDEIVNTISKTIDLINEFKPGAEIIFTISPVRHLKDGFTENQISKSLLFTALHEILAHHTNCHYFPSYELLIDDLRDYRYYAEDLVHPNKLATDYIWQKFSDALLSDECKLLLQRIERINKAVNHRVRNPHSDIHKAHVEKTLAEIKSLETTVPSISFEHEKKMLQDQLKQ